MSQTLVIGFDSAWSGNNSGAIVGVLRRNDQTYQSLGDPQAANFDKAVELIAEWKEQYCPTTTLILIDQPTIVINPTGQRGVENIVGSPISKRYGGTQPANRNRDELFGDAAPIWRFLKIFNGPADPAHQLAGGVFVVETYPTLTLIAVDLLREDNHPNPRPTRCLPKYNPEKRKPTFREDWEFVCNGTASLFQGHNLDHLAQWLVQTGDIQVPQKTHQDCVDACLCLLVGICLVENKDCMFIGNMEAGGMVVPYSEALYEELGVRCDKTKRVRTDWIRKINLSS
jgi:predicted RNase H-like nuclease